MPLLLKLKVVSCLFAAVVADPLGAGAVGDGCKLQKVLKKTRTFFLLRKAKKSSCLCIIPTGQICAQLRCIMYTPLPTCAIMTIDRPKFDLAIHLL